MEDLAGQSAHRVSGWAWSAGLQSRVQWSDFLGEGANGIYGRFGLTVANATGALGYLGIPMFAPDYVVMSDGNVHRSTGWSGVMSYEHMLSRNVKLSSNISYFNVTMTSSPEALVPAFDPILPPAAPVGFSVNVEGASTRCAVTGR